MACTEPDYLWMLVLIPLSKTKPFHSLVVFIFCQPPRVQDGLCSSFHLNFLHREPSTTNEYRCQDIIYILHRESGLTVWHLIPPSILAKNCRGPSATLVHIPCWKHKPMTLLMYYLTQKVLTGEFDLGIPASVPLHCGT